MKNHLMRLLMFLDIVWRPAYPPDDATWLEAHWTYALDIKTAWEVAGIVWLNRYPGGQGGV